MQKWLSLSKMIFLYFYQHRFVRFAFVGSLGLATNICVLYALRHVIGLIPARIVSYCVAVMLTWLLNRCFTFHSHEPKKIQQLGRYALIYTGTGCLHILAFAFLVHRFSFLYANPVWAVVGISVAVALVNFFFSKKFAFKPLSA